MKITAKCDAAGKALIIFSDSTPPAVGKIDISAGIMSVTDGTTTILGQLGDLVAGQTAQFTELNFITDIAISGGKLVLSFEKRRIWTTPPGDTGYTVGISTVKKNLSENPDC